MLLQICIFLHLINKTPVGHNIFAIYLPTAVILQIWKFNDNTLWTAVDLLDYCT